MSQCEHLILYTQFFVRHWLVLVEEPHVSQGSGQHCFSLGGVNILDDDAQIPVIRAALQQELTNA